MRDDIVSRFDQLDRRLDTVVSKEVFESYKEANNRRVADLEDRRAEDQRERNADRRRMRNTIVGSALSFLVSLTTAIIVALFL